MSSFRSQLGAPDNRKRKPVVAEPIAPVTDYERQVWTDENGKIHRLTRREFCPSDEYRHLLSPETLEALD